MMLYSPSVKGFFLPGAKHAPADCVEVSVARHMAIVRGSVNHRIANDGDAMPVLVPVEAAPNDVLEMNARNRRDALLKESDWTMMPDAPLPEEKREAWKQYRQALRDVTKQSGFPHAVHFPDKP